jgi:hypothetical protein
VMPPRLEPILPQTTEVGLIGMTRPTRGSWTVVSRAASAPFEVLAKAMWESEAAGWIGSPRRYASRDDTEGRR